MFIYYILLIGLGSFPLFITLKRMNTYRKAKKRGVFTRATITHIHSARFARGLPFDQLTLTYYDLGTASSTTAKAVTVYNKYKVGDQVGIARGTAKGQIIIPDDIKGYRPILWFSIVFLLFIVFAVVKIEEMVEAGY